MDKETVAITARDEDFVIKGEKGDEEIAEIEVALGGGESVKLKKGEVIRVGTKEAEKYLRGNLLVLAKEDAPPENPLPADFPMRNVFWNHGFTSVGDIQAKTRDELIALDGIADKTADKALAYGK